MYTKIRKAVAAYLPALAKTAVLRAVPAFYGACEIAPTSCNIMLTNRCNLRCLMCRQWRGAPGDELTTDDWRRVITDLGANGFRNIHFTGGEPLLRDDLADLVSCGVEKGYVVGLTTNGMLVTEERLRRLVESGLRSIALSIDAIDDLYEAIRGVKGSGTKVRDAAYRIGAARRRWGIDAYINFTLMKENVGAFESVKRFADEAGLPVGICLLDKASAIFDLDENRRCFWIDPNDVALPPFLAFLRAERIRRPGSILINDPGIDFIPAYFRNPRQERIPCVISQDRIFIGPAGEVFGGCLAMGTFGNIAKSSFSAIRSDEKYRRAKEAMFYKRCPGCSCGYMFNIRHMPGLIIKDAGVRMANAIRRVVAGRERRGS